MTAGIKANIDGSAAIQVGGVDAITLTSAGAASFVANPMAIQSGSASAPSLTFSGDTNTGIFSPAADTIAFSEGGVEAVRFDSSGNVGIGTSSPSSRLDVRTSAAEIARFSSSATNGGYQIFYPDNVTTPVYVGSLKAILSTGNATDFAIVGTGANNMVFGTNSAERARIDTNGYFMVGATSPTGLFTSSLSSTNNASVAAINTGASYAGDGIVTVRASRSTTNSSFYAIAYFNTGINNYRFYVNDAGAIFSTSTSITAISDQSLKENIRDLETGLTQVMALKPRRFDWKNGDAQNVAGFVAQEVENVLPELVADYGYSRDEEDNLITKKALKMGDILPTLVKAIQEQQQMIETLQAKVAALEGAE
jgi:hypothetical protein